MTTTTTTTAPVATTDEATTEQPVRFYSPSGRHMSVLATGTERREHAEWIQMRRDEGWTMAAIVAETGFSKPKCRRLLNELALTVDVEEGNLDDTAATTTAAA